MDWEHTDRLAVAEDHRNIRFAPSLEVMPDLDTILLQYSSTKDLKPKQGSLLVIRDHRITGHRGPLCEK
ncbi:MAG TPA: hypothetical protein VMW91_01570 [Desulfosporosinus sp.]|nr:hypothetical protein [Desulfosporosinus sp.]